MLLLAVLVAGAGLITYGYKAGPRNSLEGVPRSIVREGILPVQRAVQKVLRPVADALAGAFNAGDLKRSNAELRRLMAQLDSGKMESVAQDQLARITRLSGLPDASNSPEILAQVIANPVENLSYDIEINKGSSEGVGPGMAVTDGAGLVGIVTSVTSHTAIVDLVTDPQLGIGVAADPSGPIGVVRGEGGSRLTFQLAGGSAGALRPGELLYSANTPGGLAPPGVPVAMVARNWKRDPDATEVPARPAADLSELDYVEVIEWLPPA